jgi:prepilin-type N-terminal cleavage/methylation domain-containing protein
MRRCATDNSNYRRRSQRGYTLLELLLVLGILLILAGIAFPGVMRMYDRHQLQTAVENVRAHLAASRMRAIDTGLVYQFSYEPNGQSFSVTPFEAAEGHSLPTLEGTLPESFRFESPDDDQISTPPLSSTSLPGASTAGGSILNQQMLILFVPDGSATEAALDIVDEQKRFVRLSVRGLTGAVKVGRVQQRSSL